MRQVLDGFSVLAIRDEKEEMNGIYIIPNGQPHRATKICNGRNLQKVDPILKEAYEEA